jgi:hypothetical protein
MKDLTAMSTVQVDPASAQNPGEPYSEHVTQMVHIYRGWDAYESGHGNQRIVDFDLSTIKEADSFNSRREVLAALTRLYDNFDDCSDAEFLRARIKGSIAYLRALMGEQIPFPEYLSDTLGLVPRPFEAEEIEKARLDVAEWLTSCPETSGISMTAEHRERFESAFYLYDPIAIRNGIVGEKKKWLQRLAGAGIPLPQEIPLSVQFREVDAYWSNWISGSAQKGFTLTINLHARKRYDKGRPLVLCLHEVCGHAVQMTIWRDLIAKGKLCQACGLTTVHSPEMFVCEGLGQTVPDLLAQDWTYPAEFHLSRALQYHSMLVLHNAHLMIYDHQPVERILEYAIDHLPFWDPEILENEIHDRGTNPLFRTYQLSYAVGESTIRKMITGLSAAQIRNFFVEIYTRPMTPQQLQRLSDEIRKPANEGGRG